MPCDPDTVARMIESASIGVWQMDVPTGRMSRNRVFARLLQCTEADLGTSLLDWADHIHADDREQVLEYRRQMMAGQLDAYWVDYRVKGYAGGWVSLRARVAIMNWDSDGKPLCICGLLMDISRERELRHRLHALSERPFQFGGLLTPDGRVLEANHQALGVANLAASTALGNYYWDAPVFAASPQAQRQLREGIERAAGGELVRFEMSVPGDNDISCTIDFTLTPLRGHDGNVVNIIPDGRDISDLARTREALLEMERRLNTATQAGNIALWKWNILTDDAWFSDQWYRMLGLPRVGTPPNRRAWLGRVHPDDRQRVNTCLERFSAGAAPDFRVDFRMLRSDNTWGWFRSIARSVESGTAGRVEQLAGVLIDVTNQHAIEQRLVLATDGANIGLWDGIYPDGPVWVSDQWWAMLGYAAGEMTASIDMMLSLTHPDDLARVRTAVRDHAMGLTPDLDLEFRMRCKDGGWRWIHSRGRTVERAAGGQALRVIGVHIDVHDRKEAEIRLAAAARLESIGQLAAGIAHEINTPVQYVSDSVHFIRDGVRDLMEEVKLLPTTRFDDSEHGQNLKYLREHLPGAVERAMDGLARIAEIVRSMKEFSHPDQKNMTPVDLNRAIQSTLVVVKNEYKYVAELEADYGALPEVTCHIGQMNQVVLNLVVNAAHAIGDVVKDTGAKGRIGVKTWVEGDQIVISVSDSGTGIPEGIRHHIFEPFFTTKSVGRGTGQGLALVYNVVVKGHGGTVDFRSEVNRGTTFFVRIPMRRQHAEVEACIA